MTNKVDDIYEVFLSQIEGEKLALLKPETQLRQFHLYIQGAIANFVECKKDLTINNYFSDIKYSTGEKEIILNDIPENADINVIGLDSGDIYTENNNYTIENREEHKCIVLNDEIKEKVYIHVYNNGELTDDITYDEVEILAFGMTIQWLKPQKFREEIFTNVITDSAYNKLSNANLLDKLTKLYEHSLREFELRRIQYTYKGFKGYE